MKETQRTIQDLGLLQKHPNGFARGATELEKSFVEQYKSNTNDQLIAILVVPDFREVDKSLQFNKIPLLSDGSTMHRLELEPHHVVDIDLLPSRLRTEAFGMANKLYDDQLNVLYTEV